MSQNTPRRRWGAFRVLPAVALAVMLTAHAALSGCTIFGAVAGGVLGGVVAGPEGAVAGLELGAYLGASADSVIFQAMLESEYEDDWYADDWYLEEDSDESAAVEP